jgi:hypothetical protein
MLKIGLTQILGSRSNQLVSFGRIVTIRNTSRMELEKLKQSEHLTMKSLTLNSFFSIEKHMKKSEFRGEGGLIFKFLNRL